MLRKRATVQVSVSLWSFCNKLVGSSAIQNVAKDSFGSMNRFLNKYDQNVNPVLRR